MPYVSFDTEFWTDPWVEGLSFQAKGLFIYLFTNSKVRPIGVYEVSINRIAFETGIPQAKVLTTLEELHEKVTYFPAHSIVWVHNFIKRQAAAANEKYIVAVRKAIENLPAEVKDAVLRYNHDTLGIPYAQGMDTPRALTESYPSPNLSEPKQGNPPVSPQRGGAAVAATPTVEPEYFKVLKTMPKMVALKVAEQWRNDNGITLDRAGQTALEVKSKWPGNPRRPYTDAWATFQTWVKRPPLLSNGHSPPSGSGRRLLGVPSADDG